MVAPSQKAAKVARLVDSPNEGEAIAAMAALRRLLASQGLTLGDVVEAGWGDVTQGIANLTASKPYRGPIVKGPPKPVRPTSWGAQARECYRSAAQFNDWERDFLTSMMLREDCPSRRQEAALIKLLRRARGLSV